MHRGASRFATVDAIEANCVEVTYRVIKFGSHIDMHVVQTLDSATIAPAMQKQSESS